MKQVVRKNLNGTGKNKASFVKSVSQKINTGGYLLKSSMNAKRVDLE